MFRQKTVAIVITTFVCVGLSGIAGAASTSGKSLLATAIANAKSQSCVHKSSQNRSSSNAGTIVSDVCAKGSQQVLSLASGEKVTFVVRDDLGVAYVQGNFPGLHNYMGFPIAIARANANRWLKVGPASTYWQTLTAGGTLASDFDTVGKISHVVIADAHASLQKVATTKLVGSVNSSSGTIHVTLWVTQGSKPLPIQATYKSLSANIKVTWTQWGHHVNLPAPNTSQQFPF